MNAADYRAATEAAGWVDRSDRGKLAVSGDEAVAFLDSLLSQDIAAIAVGEGAEAALLDTQGPHPRRGARAANRQELLLDSERIALQALFDALRNGSLGWQVDLHKRTLECGLISVVGPRRRGRTAGVSTHTR